MSMVDAFAADDLDRSPDYLLNALSATPFENISIHCWVLHERARRIEPQLERLLTLRAELEKGR
jgi:hypothetical protein